MLSAELGFYRRFGATCELLGMPGGNLVMMILDAGMNLSGCSAPALIRLEEEGTERMPTLVLTARTWKKSHVSLAR